MTYNNLAKLICFIAFLDLLGVSMVLPLISTRLKELGASSVLIGFIGSIYGAVQLFSAPVIGSWSDVRGRRYVLLLTLVACAFGYFLMGCSSLIPVIILSRILLGLFKHSQSLSNTYLSNLVPQEQRGVYFGYFTASSNIGYIVGPTFGGHLAELPNGFFWVSSVVTAIFFLNIAIVWKFLPETSIRKVSEKTNTPKRDPHNSNASQSDRTSWMKWYIQQFQLQDCWDIMFLRLLLGFSTLVYRSSFSLVLREKFEFTPKHVGYLTSYQGTVATIAGFLVGHLTSIDMNENRQAFFGVLTLFIALLGLTVCPGVVLLVVCLTILCLSTSFLRVCLTKALASRCSKDKFGAVFGLGQSTTSVARMLAPLAGGLAMEMGSYGPSLVGTVTSGFGLMLAVFLCIQPVSKQKLKPE